MVRFFVHYYSLRCEPRVSWWRYDAYIREAIDAHARNRQEKTGALAEFLSFALNFFGPHQFRLHDRLLATLAVFPIIDVYEAFIRIVQLYLSTADVDSQGTVLCSVARIAACISDSRLAVIAAFIGVPHVPPNDPLAPILHSALDEYTRGDYERCRATCAESLALYPQCFTFAELCAKAVARMARGDALSQVEGVTGVLVRDMARVLLKNSEAEKAASDLRKRVYALPSMMYSAQLFAFLMREYVYDSFSLPSRFIAFGDLNSEYYNPRLALAIANATARDQYFQELGVVADGNTAVELYRVFSNGDDIALFDSLDVEAQRIILYKARFAQKTRDYKLAARLYRELLNATDYVLRQDALLGLNRVSAELDDYSTCLDLLADAYIENRHVLQRLPIKDVLDQIERRGADDYRGTISLPILYEILSRAVGSQYDARRDDAYEDFLAAHSVRRASGLHTIASRFPSPRLIQFLRHVCVPDVLDSSVEFHSTEELLRERISVCQLLLRLNPEASEAYSEEIKQLTQRLFVQRGVREVEQSKIHVEVHGIRRVVEKSLKESILAISTYWLPHQKVRKRAK